MRWNRWKRRSVQGGTQKQPYQRKTRTKKWCLVDFTDNYIVLWMSSINIFKTLKPKYIFIQILRHLNEKRIIVWVPQSYKEEYKYLCTNYYQLMPSKKTRNYTKAFLKVHKHRLLRLKKMYPPSQSDSKIKIKTLKL